MNTVSFQQVFAFVDFSFHLLSSLNASFWILSFANVDTDVRIDNSFFLETWAQDWDSNPDPESPRATSSMDQGAACPQFPEIEPLQAEAKNDDQNVKASQTKEISAPNGGVIKAPNGGNKTSTISFMSLKSTLLANQEQSSEGGTGLQPNPMTTTLEQDNQVANSRFLTNERTPSLSAILLSLNQNPWAHLSPCPDETPMENLLPYFVFAIYQIITRSHSSPVPLPTD
ncbi:hypothetical protein DSO57_1007704 [Entomophthora muscae]|uniref:Uncharacterized protein n=1 Tax=Entomophthora muscae TaxID=34485 RepID=A0ACC2SWG7_9FUNG|nr:hypothetical protein DSO57_1007704 [Entomophthora muscae]